MNKSVSHAKKSVTQKENVNPKERSNSLWCMVLTHCSQLKSLLLTEVCSKAEMEINSRNKIGQTRENRKYWEKEVSQSEPSAIHCQCHFVNDVVPAVTAPGEALHKKGEGGMVWPEEAAGPCQAPLTALPREPKPSWAWECQQLPYASMPRLIPEKMGTMAERIELLDLR